MVEIAKAMGWKYVSTVAAEGEYGEKGIASFVALAKREGICIAVSTKIKRAATKHQFDAIVDALASKPKARAVVLFVDEDRTRYRIRLNPLLTKLYINSLPTVPLS